MNMLSNEVNQCPPVPAIECVYVPSRNIPINGTQKVYKQWQVMEFYVLISVMFI
jgi:hypothetical protein